MTQHFVCCSTKPGGMKDEEITRTIEREDHFFDSEKDAYMYAMETQTNKTARLSYSLIYTIYLQAASSLQAVSKYHRLPTMRKRQVTLS